VRATAQLTAKRRVGAVSGHRLFDSAREDSVKSALINEVAQVNAEGSGYMLQLHDADVSHSTLYPGNERPM
jgi:hypothetical protein